jgi:hypothetical protein
MDPKTSFLLDIHLKANPRKCRKEISCYRFSKVVDPDDIAALLAEKYALQYLAIIASIIYNCFFLILFYCSCYIGVHQRERRKLSNH